MAMEKDLSKMKVDIERFKIVESFPDSPLSVTDIQFDGQSIALEDLVDITNKLTTALMNKGVIFKRTDRTH